MRDALRAAIAHQADMRLAGEAGTEREGLALAHSLKPDVLVLDLNLPDGNGWNLLERLRALDALPPTLVFSAGDDGTYAQRLLRAGARGYLMKGESLSRVLSAIRDVHAGHLVASATLTSALMKQALNLPTAVPPSEPLPATSRLSDRELQIFVLLGQGLRNKEAADRMGLSEKTVATYKARVMEKLGVRTTAELLRRSQSWQESASGTSAP